MSSVPRHKSAHGSLVGFNTAQELGLLNIVNKIGSTKGIGKLKGVQVKLHWETEGSAGQTTH